MGCFFGKEGKRHTLVFFVVDGRKTGIHTLVDRHGRDFGDARISSIASELGLTRDEFDRVLAGDMTAVEYTSLVVNKGKVKWQQPSDPHN